MKRYVKRMVMYLVLIIVFPIGIMDGVLTSLWRWLTNLEFTDVHNKWLKYKELWARVYTETSK
jgi:hypothetical protein